MWHTEDELLDGGYSLLLKREAWAMGGYAAATAYLLSKPMQAELQGIMEQKHSTSLDVERKHQLDKKGAGAKLKSVWAASRNSILQRYQHSRETEMQARQLRAATMKKSGP